MTAPPPQRAAQRPGWLHSVWAGPLLAITGAVAFSGKAIIIKLAYRHSVDAVTLIVLRMVVALPFRFSTVDFSGERTVTDPGLFGTALPTGIGHAKAFGCGLLLVRPLA